MTTRDSTTTQSASEFLIRAEAAGVTEGIRRVLVAAFRSEMEADLVEALRNNGALTISLVACAAKLSLRAPRRSGSLGAGLGRHRG